MKITKEHYLSFFLFALCIFMSGIISAQSHVQHLFPFNKGRLMGYINAEGKEIIAPKFGALGDFSEGLAAVQLNGKYGYIDYTGEFKIEPLFDYAWPFQEGLAVVNLQGNVFFIDNTGDRAFSFDFVGCSDFKNGLAVVCSKSRKCGLIDRSGTLVVDTVYNKLERVGHGLTIATREYLLKYYGPNDIQQNVYELGVLDSLGNFVIPMSNFKTIEYLKKGFFRIKMSDKPSTGYDDANDRNSLYNLKGELVFSADRKNGHWIQGALSEGLIAVELYKNRTETKDGWEYDFRTDYSGFMNAEGEIVINDTTIEYVHDFSFNRAFISRFDQKYTIIDKRGNQIGSKEFSFVYDEGFVNGYAVVREGHLHAIIDTNANYIMEPKFNDFLEIGRESGHVFFSQLKGDDIFEGIRLWGIARFDGSIVMPAVLDELYYDDFVDGVMTCLKDGRLTYVNTNGEIVWQDRYTPDTLSYLNSDHMMKGYYYAAEMVREEDSLIYPAADNPTRKILSNEKGQEGTLSVVVFPQQSDTIYERFYGMKFLVMNESKEPITFLSQAGHLEIAVQALDNLGLWRDIEYLPPSGCGNSYYTLTLESGFCWDLVAPVYKGCTPTKLRIAVTYIDPIEGLNKRGELKKLTVYSNVFDGSVNPGQFWRKEIYFPNELMDPTIH